MGSVAEDSKKGGASYQIQHEKKDGIQQWKRRFKEEERKSRRGCGKEGEGGQGCQDLLDLPEQPASGAADDGGQGLTSTRYPTRPELFFCYPNPTRTIFQIFRV